jgi:hypothetical protein
MVVERWPERNALALIIDDVEASTSKFKANVNHMNIAMIAKII